MADTPSLAARRSVAPVVPDSLRYLREFLPSTLQEERGHMKLRLNAQSCSGMERAAPLAARSAESFRADRVLDPPPNRAHEQGGMGGDDPSYFRSSAMSPSFRSGPDTSTSRRTWCPTSGPRARFPA